MVLCTQQPWVLPCCAPGNSAILTYDWLQISNNVFNVRCVWLLQMGFFVTMQSYRETQHIRQLAMASITGFVHFQSLSLPGTNFEFVPIDSVLHRCWWSDHFRFEPVRELLLLICTSTQTNPFFPVCTGMWQYQNKILSRAPLTSWPAEQVEEALM